MGFLNSSGTSTIRPIGYPTAGNSRDCNALTRLFRFRTRGYSVLNHLFILSVVFSCQYKHPSSMRILSRTIQIFPQLLLSFWTDRTSTHCYPPLINVQWAHVSILLPCPSDWELEFSNSLSKEQRRMMMGLMPLPMTHSYVQISGLRNHAFRSNRVSL